MVSSSVKFFVEVYESCSGGAVGCMKTTPHPPGRGGVPHRGGGGPETQFFEKNRVFDEFYDFRRNLEKLSFSPLGVEKIVEKIEV